MSEKLNNLTHQIEGGLSTLKKDPAYVFKSERVYKCRGKNLNMLGNSNLKKSMTKTTNGIDLLEVYCDTESQLTKQVNLLGGRAVRFTKQDGGSGNIIGSEETVVMDLLVGTPQHMGSTRMQTMGKLLKVQHGTKCKDVGSNHGTEGS